MAEIGTEQREKVWNAIDREGLVRFARDLVDIPSATGEEEECALFIEKHFRNMGLRVQMQEVEPGRPNCIGTLPGSGGGAHLLFDGHMDTSYTGREDFMPDNPAFKPKSFEEDGWIYGLGIYNMKGALACYAAAVAAVQDAGIELPGDVTVAAVVGEIERGPVDRYQGAHYRGGGVGTGYMVTHGGIADLAVIGEPTGLTLLPGHLGYMWSKVTLTGPPSHTSYSHKFPNTILQMTRIIETLHEWGQDYRERRSYRGYPANLNLAAIEGGWPYRCSRTPVYCTLYIDTRVPPTVSMMDVKNEILEVLDGVKRENPDIEPVLETLMSVPGTEVDEDSPVYQAMVRAHSAVFGEGPEVISEAYISDATYLNRFGVPALNYGPSGRLRTTPESRWDPNAGEHVSIDDLYDCTRVYASLILDVCGKLRSEVLGK
ncbi:MAG: M20/M25/M40 family metallo-hydrolase [Nitrospinota bacterium]|jgi:acetylornithine deacetylase|nr:M20/M25/M40 family metallo-hydrolase [Nitrospinota bacterium]MDP7371268.1 M20/M25/M40 family metallo-hydrolase [Nitrospinota bacterium]